MAASKDKIRELRASVDANNALFAHYAKSLGLTLEQYKKLLNKR